MSDALSILEDPNELPPAAPWPTFPSGLTLPLETADAGSIPSALHNFLTRDIRKLSRADLDKRISTALPTTIVQGMHAEWQDRLLRILSAFAPAPAPSETADAADDEEASGLNAVLSVLRQNALAADTDVVVERIVLPGRFANSFELLTSLSETPNFEQSQRRPREPRGGAAHPSSIGNTRKVRGNGVHAQGAGERRGRVRLPKRKLPAASVVVEDAAAARLAVKALSSHTRVAVDCEGVALSRAGQLCLVQVASPDAVFLFDIVSGGQDMFDAGLRELLEAPDVVKVMHDCRHDCDALLYQYNVRLGPILDTQVAFTVLRRVRSLKVGLPVALKTLLKKFVGVSEEDISVKIDIKATMRERANYWLQRPLPSDALQYARFDVVYLLHVAKVLELHITDADKSGWELVLKESASYASQFRDDQDGPRKAGLEWARLVTIAQADRATVERARSTAKLQETDPMRKFRFERDLILKLLTGRE
jgi:hypothetical protein